MSSATITVMGYNETGFMNTSVVGYITFCLVLPPVFSHPVFSVTKGSSMDQPGIVSLQKAQTWGLQPQDAEDFSLQSPCKLSKAQPSTT